MINVVANDPKDNSEKSNSQSVQQQSPKFANLNDVSPGQKKMILENACNEFMNIVDSDVDQVN